MSTSSYFHSGSGIELVDNPINFETHGRGP